MKILPEQIRDAMIDLGIEIVEHQSCKSCGEPLFYSRIGDRLYFNSACGCGWQPPEPRGWRDAAHWINAQTNPEYRQELMSRFGLSV